MIPHKSNPIIIVLINQLFDVQGDDNTCHFVQIENNILLDNTNFLSTLIISLILGYKIEEILKIHIIIFQKVSKKLSLF